MKKPLYSSIWLLSLLCTLLISSCKDNDGVIFSIQDDINLGQQVAHEIDSTNRAQGKLIEPSNNPTAYTHLNNIVNKILNSGKVKYQSEFPWRVRIIREPETLNAFATPGGQIYVYTGLIKYLNDEDHFAGVLAHEIAHADRRHSLRQLQRDYGIAILLSVALGNNPGTLTQIATQLTQLRFSRDAETEADSYSVEYLSGTNYACDGAAGFFEKMEQDASQTNPPEFLSTHPNPGNRIQSIRQKAQEVGCSTSSAPDNDFNALKRSLGL